MMATLKMLEASGAEKSFDIPIGVATEIGREFLSLTDKRLSRKQLVLEVCADGSMFVQRAGPNPSFYRTTGADDQRMELAKGDRVAIPAGGLLFLAQDRTTRECQYPLRIVMPTAAAAATAAAAPAPAPTAPAAPAAAEAAVSDKKRAKSIIEQQRELEEQIKRKKLAGAYDGSDEPAPAAASSDAALRGAGFDVLLHSSSSSSSTAAAAAASAAAATAPVVPASAAAAACVSAPAAAPALPPPPRDRASAPPPAARAGAPMRSEPPVVVSLDSDDEDEAPPPPRKVPAAYGSGKASAAIGSGNAKSNGYGGGGGSSSGGVGVGVGGGGGSGGGVETITLSDSDEEGGGGGIEEEEMRRAIALSLASSQEQSVAAAVPSTAPTMACASSSVVLSRAAPPPNPATDARRAVDGPGTWKVRRNRAFVPYNAAAQAVLEEAYTRGAAFAMIHAAPPPPALGSDAKGDAPIEYRVEFGNEAEQGGRPAAIAPHKQVQASDARLWRPVCRVAGEEPMRVDQEPVAAAASIISSLAETMPASVAVASMAPAPPAAAAPAEAAAAAAAAPPAAVAAPAAAAAAAAAAMDPPRAGGGGAGSKQPVTSMDEAVPPLLDSAHSAQLAEMRELARARYERQQQQKQQQVQQRAEEKQPAEPVALPTTPLRIMSFNVWFEVHAKELRMKEIARLASGGLNDASGRPLQPAAIALQELTPSLHRTLQAGLVGAGYAPIHHQPWADCAFNGAEQYGVGLTTRHPLGPLTYTRFHPYRNSMMGRGLTLGTTVWSPAASATSSSAGAPRIVLGSTHLESFTGPADELIRTAARREQLVEACRVLAMEMKARGAACAMLLGDMNWDDNKHGEALKHIAPTGWRDGFLEAGSPKGMSNTCYGNRFDRCFILDAGAAAAASALRATGVHLAGKEQGPHLQGQQYTGSSGQLRKLYPSDHKGPLFTFEARTRGGV